MDVDSDARMGGSIVLIVEDDPSLRLLCRVNLELEQFTVLEAETLAQAVELVRSNPIDVVLLDMHVGEDHGFELLPHLRESRPEAAVCLAPMDLHIAVIEAVWAPILASRFSPSASRAPPSA